MFRTAACVITAATFGCSGRQSDPPPPLVAGSIACEAAGAAVAPPPARPAVPARPDEVHVWPASFTSAGVTRDPQDDPRGP